MLAHRQLSGRLPFLLLLTDDGEAAGPAVAVVDCIGATADDCTGIDQDPDAGEFLVTGLAAGTYRLIETAAPAGYILDDAPRDIVVAGDTTVEDPIENVQRDALIIPFTGGQSALIYTLCGTVLAAAALALATRQRVAQMWARPSVRLGS